MLSTPLPVAMPLITVRRIPSANSRWTSPVSTRLYWLMKSSASVSTRVKARVASLLIPSGARSR